MNNCTTPTCTVSTIRQGPWFLLSPLEVSIPHRLRTQDYATFSFEREFAGLSARGIPLSVKGSTSLAAIGTIPLVPEKPKGWVVLPHFIDAGLLVTTDTPRFAFFGMRNGDWRGHCTSLCIHPDDLANIIELPNLKLTPELSDLEIDTLNSPLVVLLARHAGRLKVLLQGEKTYIRVPSTVRLASHEWAMLKRHVFTGNSSVTVAETTVVRDPERCEECFKLPGHCTNEIISRWGAIGKKPWAYDGKHLCFTYLQVLQGAKLGRLFRNAELLEGRFIKICGRDAPLAFDLSQALAAGIVPPDGVLHVNPSIEAIHLPADNFTIGRLKRPVLLREQRWEDPVLLCPQDLVLHFLISARQAVRKYAIPADLSSFRVRTQKVFGSSDEDPVGTYYLLEDLEGSPPRDLKRELAERRARHKRLIDRYGSALPGEAEKLSDEDIALYFELQDLVQSGEFIRAQDHPLMPTSYILREIVDWLKAKAPQLVLTCPLTEAVYIRSLNGFEDLADIPGFWHAIEAAVNEGPWLRKLVTCPKVQAAALVSAI
jgi:hypothetical protein